MFGYVVPNQAALSDEAQKRYRTAYCGLCRRIDALHGLRGRFTLSYDLTFLNLLLCSLYEGETEASSGHDRCPIHPLGGVEWRAASPTDYCADLSVALHYYNAEDKWKDDRSLLGLGYEKLLTGYKTRFIRILCSIFISQFTRQFYSCKIYFTHIFFHVIICHRNRSRT